MSRISFDHQTLIASRPIVSQNSSESKKHSKQRRYRVEKSSTRSVKSGSWSFLLSPLAEYTVPCFLAVVCYFNGIPGDFLHDDTYAIESNRDVRGETSLVQLFRNDFWGKSMVDPRSHKSFRPLTVLTFRFDYLLSAGDPRWFHVVNITLHTCATAMVVLLSMRILRATPMVAILAAAHFAVHPIHTEAVTGIVGRADVLSALFFLASFYCYSRCIPDTANAQALSSSASPDTSRASPVRDLNFNHLPSTSASPIPTSPKPQSSQRSNSTPKTFSTTMLPVMSHGHFLFLLASLALAGTAVLCKETGMSVLGVAFLYDLLLNRLFFLRWSRLRDVANLKPLILRLCCLCVWSLLIIVLRMWVMDFQQPTFKVEDNPASIADSLLTRVLTFMYLPVVNLWLLLCPVMLSYDWAVGSIPLVTNIGDLRNIWTGLTVVVLLILAWRSIRNLFTQAEISGSTPPMEEKEVTIDHSSPSFILIMGLVLLCFPFLPASNLFFKVGFVVAERVLYIPSIGFSLLMAQGLSCLSDRLPGLRVAVTLSFVTLLLVLGIRTIHRNQDWMSRRSLFVSGVRSLPHNAKMHYNMANLLRDEGNMDTAELHYREAIRLNPAHPSYHLNLGAILTNRSEAESCYQEALRLHPEHVGALVNLANLWTDDGKVSSGMSLLKQALSFDPNHAEALLAYGKALLAMGETWRAGKHIQKALLSRPNWASTHYYYAAFLQYTDDLEGALREYMRAIDLDEEESTAMNNAARILISLGRFSEAEPLLKRALSIHPSCSDCLSALATSYSRRGQHSQAVVTLGQATTLAPNDTNISLKYVEALKQSKQTEKAQMLLQKLLARVPEDLTVLTFAYNYAMEEERLSDASHYIREAVSVAEQTSHISLSTLYYEQGEIYRLTKDYDNALKFYKKSITKDHHRIDAIVSAGSILYLKRNYSEAEVYYLKALRQDPDNRLAKQNLAKLRNFLDNSGSHT